MWKKYLYLCASRKHISFSFVKLDFLFLHSIASFFSPSFPTSLCFYLLHFHFLCFYLLPFHFLLPHASIYSLMLLSTPFPFPTPPCFYLPPLPLPFHTSSCFLTPHTSPISYSLMLIHTSSPSPVSFSFMRISTPLSLPRFLRTYANTYPQLSISRFLFPHTSTYPLFLSRFLLPRPECFNLPPFHASSTPLCCYLPPLDLNLHCLL